MKNSLAIFCAISLFSSVAVAAEQWVPAGGDQCDKVCGAKKLLPVAVTNIAGYAVTYVCSGDYNTNPNDTQDKNFRPGFTATSGSTLGCAIYGGGGGGRIPTSFSCLCIGE